MSLDLDAMCNQALTRLKFQIENCAITQSGSIKLGFGVSIYKMHERHDMLGRLFKARINNAKRQLNVRCRKDYP